MFSAPALRAFTGIALLSIMDAMIKAMTGAYPISVVAFLRFGVGALICLAILTFVKSPPLTWAMVKANAVRSFAVVGTASTLFYALSTLPLAEAMVLTFTAPIFVAILSVLVLKEEVDGRVVAALGTGFLGTVIVVLGQGGFTAGERSLSGILAALASAVFYAFYLVLLRQRAQKDHFLHIILIQNVGASLLLSPAVLMQWQMPAGGDWLLFLIMGILGMCGHILLILAFAKAPAARIAPLEYTALLWAASIGYLWFGEVPALTTLIGAAFIICGAVMTSRR